MYMRRSICVQSCEFGAALAGVHGEDGVAGVVRAAEHERQFESIELMQEAGGVTRLLRL